MRPSQSQSHIPVLLKESVDALGLGRLEDDPVVVDATLGEGGHAREILERLPAAGRLIGIERDHRMLSALTLRDPRLTVVEGNFRNSARILKTLGHDWASAILADLGLSTRHYQTPEWGFSFVDGPLDMRLDPEGPTAADLVNGWREDELAACFLSAGERAGRKIARALVRARKEKSIRRTSDLAGIVADAVRHTERAASGRSHPATKVFRALREAVTGELKDLAALVSESALILAPGGRLAILTYTWEEERLVRLAGDAEVKGCVCPPRFPVCRCGRRPSMRWVDRKGIHPSEGEVKRNPSARSATLLVLEKIQAPEKISR